MPDDNVNLIGDKLFHNSKKTDAYISTLKPHDMGYFNDISSSGNAHVYFPSSLVPGLLEGYFYIDIIYGNVLLSPLILCITQLSSRVLLSQFPLILHSSHLQ